MALYSDGRIIFHRLCGKIEEEIVLERNLTVTLLKNKKFQIKSCKITRFVESEEAIEWVRILNQII